MLFLCVSLRRETDGVSGDRGSCGDEYLSRWLRGSFIGDQWPRMKSNTYIKGEGIREEASYLTTHLRYHSDLLFSHTGSTFPKENRLFLLTDRHHFRSLNCVKNKENSEKVTHDLFGLSDFFIHNHTEGFYIFMWKKKSFTVIE